MFLFSWGGYVAGSGWRPAGRDDVDVTLRVAPEGTHVFQLYFGALDEADEALDEVARFFRRHLG
jgi:acetyl esterase/lipase